MIKQSKGRKTGPDSGWTLRIAGPEDAAALLSIYRQYIDTPITFETELPSEEEFAGRIRSVLAGYPWILCEDNEGRTVGYAYAHRHMERAAYQWNAELSIYLDQNATSHGLGKRLYSVLIDILREQGVHTVYGGVTFPNEKSEKLHLGCGFTKLGTYHNAGYKAGGWYDVMWFEKGITAYADNPSPVIPFPQLSPGRVRDFLTAARDADLR